MRGKFDPQAVVFSAAIDLEGRIRPDHPLRPIKRMADEDLRKMSRRFDAAYAGEGRPSVPPERLIKAMLLQAIYSIRSEAQLVERIDHDLLFRWFLDMRPDEPVFDATVFCHNRRRLEKHDLVGGFFDTTVRRAVASGLVSPDHFSVDGSLIEPTRRSRASNARTRRAAATAATAAAAATTTTTASRAATPRSTSTARNAQTTRTKARPIRTQS